MIRHSALFRFHETVPADRAAEFDRGVGEALRQIPHIAEWSAGPGLGIQGGGYDYALHLDFADGAAFEAYKRHPAHVTLIEEHIVPVVADTARIQIHL